MKILFCQLRNHGDIIRIFPLLDAIKSAHPTWYIGFTCFENMVEVCDLCKSIDVVIPQPRFSPVVDTEDCTRILNCNILSKSVATAKYYNFDVYVDLHGVFQSALFGSICGINIRLGRSKETTKDGAHLFYTHICEITQREINRMERHFIIFNKLFPEIQPMEGYDSYGERVIIFPGSSQKGILKRYKAARYASIANYLAMAHKVLIALGPEDIDLCNELKHNTNCEIRVFQQWSEILREMNDCKLVLGNDCAYLHMAIWKHIPSVMICGPLSSVINGIWKYGKGAIVCVPHSCKCSNVWSGKCHNNHQCMEDIAISDVIRTVKQFL